MLQPFLLLLRIYSIILLLFRFLDHDDDDVSQNVSGFGYSYLAVLKQVIQIWLSTISQEDYCALQKALEKLWNTNISLSFCKKIKEGKAFCKSEESSFIFSQEEL